MGQLLLWFDGFDEAGRNTGIINVYGVLTVGRLVGMPLQYVINSMEQKTSVKLFFQGKMRGGEIGVVRSPTVGLKLLHLHCALVK